MVMPLIQELLLMNFLNNTTLIVEELCDSPTFTYVFNRHRSPVCVIVEKRAIERNFSQSPGRQLIQEIDYIMNSLRSRRLSFDKTELAFAFTDFAFMTFYLRMFLSTV
jgi:hypothetical protein